MLIFNNVIVKDKITRIKTKTKTKYNYAINELNHSVNNVNIDRYIDK